MHTDHAWLFLMPHPFPLFLLSLGQKNHLSSPRLDLNKWLSAYSPMAEGVRMSSWVSGGRAEEWCVDRPLWLSPVYRVPTELGCRLFPQTTCTDAFAALGTAQGMWLNYTALEKTPKLFLLTHLSFTHSVSDIGVRVQFP